MKTTISKEEEIRALKEMNEKLRRQLDLALAEVVRLRLLTSGR